MEKADLPLKVKWINDPKVHKYLHYEIPLGWSKTENWFDKTLKDDTRRDFIIESDEGKPIGVTGLIGITLIHRTAEYYLAIGEEKYRGRGLGTYTLRLLAEWAFNTLDLHKIWGTARIQNKASIAMMKKVGFKTEATLREEKYISNRRENLMRMGLLRREYRPEKAL